VTFWRGFCAHTPYRYSLQSHSAAALSAGLRKGILPRPVERGPAFASLRASQRIFKNCFRILRGESEKSRPIPGTPVLPVHVAPQSGPANDRLALL
jgi:hypothetical protein